MRVMSAGEGYKYLLKTVAAGDGNRSLSTPLTRYYLEEGTPPGCWMGSGVTSLGGGRIVVGDQVSEAQLQLLVGMGRDPVTGDPLGRAYQDFSSSAARAEARIATLDPSLGVVARAEAIVQIEAEEAARGTRRAVAGFDFTFSIPKAASAVWAVADAGTQAIIADAHHAAVAEVVAFMEREIAATRVGATGRDGAVAQVGVGGLIATAFDHYDSRAGDPHLHTHVVFSNKVQTLLDGKWRSLDGRPLHAAVVALSELHEAVFADHLTRTLGVEWEARSRGRDRNPTWAITTVPESLITLFSSRSRHIDQEADRLIERYIGEHGRRPSPATIVKLRAQATLTTRPDKQVQSLAALTAQWRERASASLGEDATEWVRRITAAPSPPLLRADDIPLDVIRELGQTVIEVVGEKRATWRRWNLYAEAARQTMGLRFASTTDREAIVGMIADAAEAGSLCLTPPELASSPAIFRRPDGTSAFRPKHSTAYSSEQLLAAEDRLLERSHLLTAPTLDLAQLERVTRRPDRRGLVLGYDQAAALATVAVSGRVLDVLVGPAGAGKTTAMSALRRAWEMKNGDGSVIGLAPSAAAAQVLGHDLGIVTENTAKWWQNHLVHGTTFHAGQLVIIDEASLAGTLTLDRITALVAQAGAKTLLVGDWAQLQSVDAGGALSMLVHDRDDAPELVDIHRFTNPWEKAASLGLRHGNASAIDEYESHGRIHDGDTDAMTDAAYTGWRSDMLAGRESVLIAETHESVTSLNQRARADLILDGSVTPLHGSVELHDGTVASPGDTVISRRNDRRLRAGRSWVRNGDRWTMTAVRSDGSVTVRRAGRRRGAALVLPAGYVREHLDLGYAVTAHRAQGLTTDTAHALIEATTTKENLYVAMTRGREANHAYVATDRPDSVHAGPHPGDNIAASARTVLFGVVQHSGAELSAHETITSEQEAWSSIRQIAAEYETIATAAQQDRWAELIRRSGLTDQEAEDAIASDAFGALAAELRYAEANHHDVAVLLPRLVASRSLHDADDIAAVLHARLAAVTARPAGSGRARRAPRLIAGLIPEADGPMDAQMRRALHERRQLIEDRAQALARAAAAEHLAWAGHLGAPPTRETPRTRWWQAAATVAAYRDRYGITADTPLGAAPDSTAQRLDAARARAALDRARALTDTTEHNPWTPSDPHVERSGPSL